MPTFTELLDAEATTLTDLQAHLGSLDSETRVAECRALTRPRLRRLYELAGTGAALTPEELIDADSASTTPVQWKGRNSLAAFVLFEKHFVRHAGAIVGINVQKNIQWFTGPGYFTCRIDETHPNEVLIDYTLIPTAAPDIWPKIKPNSSGFSRFVYHNMYDYVRRVSPTVVIGAATRLGKPIDHFFVLCKG